MTDIYGPAEPPMQLVTCDACGGEGEVGTGRMSHSVNSATIDPPWEIMKRCERCGGQGEWFTEMESDPQQDCPACGGRGFRIEPDCCGRIAELGYCRADCAVPREVECDDCSGCGKIPEHGSGAMTSDATLEAVKTAVWERAGYKFSDESARHVLTAVLAVVGKQSSGQAVIENGSIVIRVAIDALQSVITGKSSTNNEPVLYKVTNKDEFAADLVRALNDEDEQGTTRVHKMFDTAIEYAIDQGAFGIDEHKCACMQPGGDPLGNCEICDPARLPALNPQDGGTP